MSISAMKQALEALEEIHPGNMTPMAEEAWNKSITALKQAIAEAEKQEGWVLREVYFSEGEPISHREPQWVGLRDEELPEGETYDFDRGVRWAERYLKQKAVPSDYLNSHQQEPVAFVSGYYGGQCVILPIYKDKLFSPGTALYTTPVHASENTEKQEPVANSLDWWALFDENQRLRAELKFNTAPPQREWVGLEDEEINEAQDTAAVEFKKNKYRIRGQMIMPGDSPDWWFARAIEAKLKEKNG